MPLPLICCPACNAKFTLDVLFAHEGARETMLLIVNAHPEGARLLGPLIRYVGLFAPAKNELTFDRIAKLIAELVPQIRAAQIERSGRIWAAPVESWRTAFEEMLARRDKLQLPLKSHGYLLEIVAGMANRSEAGQEAARDARMASGARDVQERNTAGPVAVKHAVKAPMPDAVREQLKNLTKGGSNAA